MYICTYERNIYLSVRRIYEFTNGFLLIALANCESNEPYVNCIFSSTQDFSKQGHRVDIKTLFPDMITDFRSVFLKKKTPKMDNIFVKNAMG